MRERSFSRRSFPEILSVQVSRLVSKMKEESTGDTESETRRQLRDRIALLSQSQLARATDALAMIWSRVIGPLDSPMPEVKRKGFILLSKWNKIYPIVSSWDRVKLALLKSISTGTFIDVQFYAYNAVQNGAPSDPKPLFISSIVIQKWMPAITTRESKASLNLFHSDMRRKKQ